MAIIKINVNGITNNVKPPLTKSITYLEQAKSILSSINVPSDFSYTSTLKGTITTINNSKTKINNISKWATEAVQKFQQAESKNNKVVSSIISKSISNNMKKVNATVSKAKKTVSSVKSATLNIKNKLANIINTGAKVVKKYTTSFASKIKSGIQATKSKISTAFTTVVSKVKETVANITQKVQSLTTKAITGINTVGTKVATSCKNFCKTAIDEIKNFGEKALEFTKSIIADVTNTVVSLIKGLADFGESIFDTLVIAITGAASIVTGIVDGVTYLASKINGTSDDWQSQTVQMWKDTMAFVAEDHVGNAFDSFYENTAVGQWLDEHAHEAFKSDGIVCQVAEGIGYVAGVVLLSIATLGIGTAVTGVATSASAMTTASSIIAASAGLGKYTAEYWENAKVSSWKNIEEMYENGEISEEDYQAMQQIRNLTDDEWAQIEEMYKNGEISEDKYNNMLAIREMSDEWTTMENLKNGLLYGAANGAWEGLQWYVGGKLAGWTIKGASKLATSSVRVGIDTLFNGGDTFFRAGVSALTSDQTLIEAWKAQGGWNSVLTNVLIGLVGSVGGETFDGLSSNKFKTNADTDNQYSQITKKLNNEKLYEDVDQSLIELIKTKIAGDHYIRGEIDLTTMSTSELKQYIKKEETRIKDNLFDIINNSDFNKNNLIEGIISKIPSDLDDITKARMIYLKLNQTVSYSDEYFAMNQMKDVYKEELSDIYYKNFDIADLSTNSVICSNWSEIYKELLETSGISSEYIEIMSNGSKTGSHKWIKIDLDDGNIILADATNNINGLTDLTNVKLGNETAGFVLTTQEEFEKVYNGNNNSNYIFQVLNNEKVGQIDNTIGYSTGQYMEDMNDIINMYQDGYSASMEEIINSYKSLFDTGEYTSLELYTISRDYVEKLFGADTEIHLYTKDSNVITIIEYISDQGEIEYLYKINDETIKNINSVDDIIKGAKQIK